MSRIRTFLKGVKVLDLSRHLPGPLATLMMVDLGATVLKVESPDGDEVRQLGPVDAQGRNVYFETLTAGKEWMRLDLKSDAGRAELLRLVRDADVLLESFRPGVMGRLGLAYSVLSKINPRLIYCSLNGFGRASPWERRAAHDANYLALAGALDRNGAGRPMPFEPAVADTSGSLFAVIAILGALRARESNGRGCQIDAALADVPMPLQMLQIAEMHASGTVPRGGSGPFDGGTAFYQTYRTLDGRYVMLGAVEAKFWRAFCLEAGRPDWIARQDEPLPQEGLRAEVAAFFSKLTFAQCCARFDACDCCFSPVLDLRESVESDHVKSRRVLQRSIEGDIQALFPVHVDGEPPQPRERARPVAPGAPWHRESP
jgi:crotonobetainyl-CoA:carnitine CoA-transferase CaiB-like acyl-CoA transferase